MSASEGTKPSIQESLFPDLSCFGCGHANAHGLHLRSCREGGITVAEFDPLPERVDPSQIIVRSAMSVDDKMRASMTASWAPFHPR